MSSEAWHTYLRPHRAPETPAAMRLILAILSGAILSLSYRGSFSSLYSWVCLALLLACVLGSRDGWRLPAVFCTASFSFSRACRGLRGALGSRRHAHGRGLGRAPSDRLGVGRDHRAVRAGGTEIVEAQCALGARWRSLPLDFDRGRPRIFAGNQFSLGLVGVSRGSNPAFVQLTTLTGFTAYRFWSQPSTRCWCGAIRPARQKTPSGDGE